MAAPVVRRRYGCVVLLVLVVLSSGVRAQEPHRDNFAEHLCSIGEYYRAITEYFRLSFLASDQQERLHYLQRIALCYYRGRDYEGMRVFSTNSSNQFLGDSTRQAAMTLLYAKSAFHLGLFQDAIATLEKPAHGTSNDSLLDERHYFLGLSYAHLDNWGEAYKCFGSIARDRKYIAFRDLMLARRLEISSSSPKNSTLAGVLSAVIPGTGYIYSGRTITGLTSLLVNGLLVWSVYDAINNKQYGLAFSVGFFGMGWYIGNISGSISAAEQCNAAERERFLRSAMLPE